MSTARPDDPRYELIRHHLSRLSTRYEGRRLVVNDYLDYRRDEAPELPALTTVYRLFGSWPDALSAAGVEQETAAEVFRTPDDKLIAALNQAARELGVDVLSTHAYDAYRISRARHLPSSSVIRKWLGRWEQAVVKAGLTPPARSGPRKPTFSEITDALRRAKERTPGVLSAARYAEVMQAYPMEAWPEVEQILAAFPTWETALRAADVEQADVLHPDSIWTTEEARRIMTLVERVLRTDTVTCEQYEEVRAQSQRPMPSWEVIVDLLYGDDTEQ